MIPDNIFNFNQYGAALGNFDDHEARLRHVLRQDATPTLEGGRHLLNACPVCKQAWYKVGRHEYARPTVEQLAFLGASLHANITALHLLPRALCPICSTVYLGGMFLIEEYPLHGGCSFLWESASPRRNRLLAIVCQRKGLALDLLLQMAPYPLTETALPTVRSVLAWIEETCPDSHAVRAFSDEESHHLAQRCSAGYTADGKALLWRGYTWEDICPALGGDVLASLAVAVLPRASSPFASLLMRWSVLARTMRLVL